MADTAIASIIGHPPSVVITERTLEQAKYETMWTKDEYRKVAPGELVAETFVGLAQPKQGSTVIDFGCGTGRGALMLALLGGVKVEMVDFAVNCLDEDIRPMLVTQAHAMRFTQHDLTKPLTLRAQYGFCTDVMEHIPTEDVDKVLLNILQAAQHVFFQISCVDDSCGKLIGEVLHHTVRPGDWWVAKLRDLGCTVHFYSTDEQSCIIYATLWMTGEALTKEGKLNVEEETIKANVRENVKLLLDGWQQVRPFETQDTNVMILGGGPSLDRDLDMIRAMRAQGAKLVTLNGAYNWAIKHGLKVSAQIMVDARPFNKRFVEPVQDETLYLIGSQCDPSVFAGLPKERTWMWHTSAETIQDELKELDWWIGIPGGCTVLLRAIPLLHMLGYQQFHLFGCDSCLVDDKHHAYSQQENDGQVVVDVTCGPRMFKCNPWHVAQAHEFMELIKVMGDQFELQVYGDGLLAWILKYGYQLDVEAEEANTA